MPTTSEYNQFRRYIGDYATASVSDTTIDSYLNDATRELTSDFVDVAGLPAVLTAFDTVVPEYHPEIILKAAINWWWNRAAELADKHSQTVGQASQNVSEKWDRAMQMIQQLQTMYDQIESLGVDITFGNLSYFSKSSLERIGGQREEVAIKNG